MHEKYSCARTPDTVCRSLWFSFLNHISPEIGGKSISICECTCMCECVHVCVCKVIMKLYQDCCGQKNNMNLDYFFLTE